MCRSSDVSYGRSGTREIVEYLEPRQLLSAVAPGRWILEVSGLTGSPSQQVELIDASLEELDGEFKGELKATRHLGRRGVFLLEAPEELSKGELASELGSLNGFKRIEEDTVIHAAATVNDPRFNEQ